MATNKWLADMQTLKSNADALRQALRDGNVTVNDNDTLGQLVGKVPSLAPIEMSEEDKWQPDPLWKFPDPNLTETTKTIREIYDEDTMANDYTYRGIYQIRADVDDVDLKWLTGNRTNADTFITSDGSTYTNITTANQLHTFNPTYDVTDSLGRKMRYIKVYSNIAYNYISGFANQSIWIINNMGTTANDVSSLSTSTYNYYNKYAPIECYECGSNVTSISAYSYYTQKIKSENTVNLNYFADAFNLRELDLKFYRISISGNYSYGLTHTKVKEINLDNTYYTDSSFVFKPYGSNYANSTITIINGLENINSITTIDINYMYALKKLILPPNTTTLSAYGQSLTTLALNNNLNSLTINNMYLLNSLDLPSSLTKLSMSYLYSLKHITIPYNFNLTGLNLSNSYLLSAEQLIGVLENLADLTGQTAKTITLGTTLKAKLTTEQLEIATNKNWTVA